MDLELSITEYTSALQGPDTDVIKLDQGVSQDLEENQSSC